MNLTCVDVGDAPIEVGDEVVVFGQRQGDERVTVEEAAEAAQTIGYELLVRVGRHVPREYED